MGSLVDWRGREKKLTAREYRLVRCFVLPFVPVAYAVFGSAQVYDYLAGGDSQALAVGLGSLAASAGLIALRILAFSGVDSDPQSAV